MTRNTQPDQSEPTQFFTVRTQFFTVSETARYLHLCEKQVRRLIWRGELAAFRFGTALRIHKADIAAYVASRHITPVKTTSKAGI